MDKRKFWLIARKYATLMILAIFLIAMAFLTDRFYTFNNLMNVGRQISMNAIIAIGMTLVISSGGIDISTGSMMAFAGFIVAKGITSGGNFWLFTILALIACGLVGAFSGFLIGKFKVQPVILTLVMQIVMRGVTVMLAQSNVFPLDRKTLYPEANLLGVYRFPGDARVYERMLEMLKNRPEQRAFAARLLGRYGDARAIEPLKALISMSDITYYEYMELRNAVEALGGEIEHEREFYGDPDYEYLRDLE